MTTTELSKAQLATVLSALDERPRNPANRTEALKAIGKSAQRYGHSAEDVLAAAPGLLDGRLSPAEFRAELQDLADEATAARDAGPAGKESTAADQEPTAPEGAPAPAQALPKDGQEAPPANGEPGTTEGAAAAPQAPTAAAESREARRTPREGTKQALLISMLRRPEGATVDEVVAATGWQRHTVRGAISGALKKKLSLEVTSEKVEGRGRVYRIAGPDAVS